MHSQRRRRTSADPHELGRLTTRPTAPTQRGASGLHPLGLGAPRDGLLYVPPGYTPDRPAPLAVMLHGAGGNSGHGLALWQRQADEAGIIVLAPQSEDATWDVIVEELGPDVALIDRALAQVVDQYAVDATRLAVGGFSDGASYALSLGLINGDVFSHVIAFSPGFMALTEQNGAPRVFVSHGVHDSVLPIDRCSRRLVPLLKQAEYDVRYEEFDGPHTVPPPIADAARHWFLE